MSVSYVPGVPFTSYITGSLVKFDPKVNDLCVIAKFTSKSRVTQRILHYMVAAAVKIVFLLYIVYMSPNN